MPAYVVVEIEITDPETFEQYKPLAPATIAHYGGRYLVRGGKITTLEGNWTPERVTVLEFPSVADAEAWWNSPEYSGPKAMRHRATNSRMIVLEGLG